RVDGLRLFQFGDDVDLIAAQRVQQGTELFDVAPTADERGGDVVELILYGEGDVLAVLRRDCRNGQLRVRKIHPLARGDRSAVQNPRDHPLRFHRGDHQLHEAVVDQNALAHLDLARQRGERSGDDRGIAGEGIGGDDERRTGLQLNDAVDISDAQLRPLNVADDRNVLAELRGGLAE